MILTAQQLAHWDLSAVKCVAELKFHCVPLVHSLCSIQLPQRKAIHTAVLSWELYISIIHPCNNNRSSDILCIVSFDAV